MNPIRRSISLGLLALACPSFRALAQENHAHHKGMKAPRLGLGTSAAIDAQGQLWIARTEPAANEPAAGQPAGAYVALQTSRDMGKTWSAAKRVQQAPEPIEAEGESRPKVAFGARGEIYVAYTRPLGKPYTGEIRFARSVDGGRTFSPPVTVHANRDPITHRFESMIVDRAGRLYIAWVDKRDGEAARARNEKYEGAAIYYAVSDDGGASFRGDYKLADHSCECCRIGLALDPRGRVVAMWRHVFEPNIRDHAMAELGPDGKAGPLQRVSFDDWHIDACPHHGPALAFADDGVRHQVWFSGKEDGGALYATAAPGGKPGAPVRLGSELASHPDVAVQGRRVAIAWKQFDGSATAIRAKVSDDGGVNWQEKEAARTTGESDHPHLLTSASGIFIVWRTQNEGLRILPLGKGNS